MNHRNGSCKALLVGKDGGWEGGGNKWGGGVVGELMEEGDIFKFCSLQHFSNT